MADWTCTSCHRGFSFATRFRGGRHSAAVVCGACYERQRRAATRYKHGHFCEQCGDAFTTTRIDAVYCSATCRQRARRAQFTPSATPP